MPKRKKQSKHCSAAAKKRWNNTKSNHKLSDTEELSDDQQQRPTNLWMENENEPLCDDQFTEELGRVQADALEELIKNARQSDAWVVKGRKPIYTGFTESTLRNKRAACNVAQVEFLAINLISLLKETIYKRSLKRLDTCAFSIQSFIVNSILLSHSGVRQSGMHVFIAIIRLRVSRQLFRWH